MKRILSAIIIIAILMGFGIALKASDLQPISFAFIGRWQPSEDPVLIDDNGFQDVQNVRKYGKHFRGISGHTAINSTSISSYPYFLNGFQFRKDQPEESHVFVMAADSVISSSYLYKNIGTVPNAADFVATAFHTDAAGGLGTGRFAIAPDGNMIYANGVETLIWGGNESPVTAFIVSTDSLTGTSATLTNPQDYSDQVRNTRQTADQVAFFGSGIDAYTKLLLHGNSTDGSTVIVDEVSTVRAITSAHTAEHDTDQKKFGSSSILFTSASSTYLSVADDADWNLAAGDFTIDTWIRFNTLPDISTKTVTYTYTGASTTFTVPAGITSITVDVRGAQGGGSQGGKGGMVVSTHTVTPAETLTVYVGQQGQEASTGWNGGGSGESDSYGGGGGSDIRQGGTALANRIVVAGGGGGTGYPGRNGGYGGYPAGEMPGPYAGYGGTQAAGGTYGTGCFNVGYAGSLGQGGAARVAGYNAGGGGGGYYGGGGGGGGGYCGLSGGGGGGSSYSAGTSVTYTNEYQSGHGSVSISYLDTGTDAIIVSQASTLDLGWSIVLSGKTTDREIEFIYSSDGSTSTTKGVTWNPVASTWYHLAVERATTSLKFFVDGTQQGTSQTISDTTIANSGRPMILGGSEVASYFNGWLDEFRLSNGIARYSDTFVPNAKEYASDSAYFLVGFTRPIQGVKFYVLEGNNITSTMGVKEWNGTSWTALSVTDNTSNGTISLANTGTITWSSTVNTSKPKYINGLSLYWYQFALSAGWAKVYYVTVDAPMQSIKNIWSGEKAFVSKCIRYDGANYADYTDGVNDEITTGYLDVSSLSTAGYVLVGFTDPQQALELTMLTGSENSTASTTMSMYYWNGSAWTAVTAPSDGTATTTTSLNKSGVVSFQPLEPGTEFPTAISDEAPLYYYKFSFAAAPDSTTKVNEIRGIAAPAPLATYKFAATFQNRLFLFNEYNGDRNKAIYSVENAPHIFNGSDTGSLYFGDNTEVTAAAVVYNVFENGAMDQMIVAKKNETYRVSGDDPDSWLVKQISATTGCVAPLSMVSVDATRGKEKDIPMQVVIWQGDKGFYMTDGTAVVPISEDINCYFDPNDSRYIPVNRRKDTVGWYDPSIRSYKALISSGSTAVYHNIELEYSLLNQEWTKIHRHDASGDDPLQCGFQVFDTNGIGYTYGGNTKGFMYRLENGQTFAGTNIEQIIWTKDMILDTQAPLFRKSTVKHLRTALKKKASGGTITIAHYGDQTLTVSGTSNQLVPSAITMATAPYNTQSCALGPFLYHSFKFTASACTATDGMELIGLGIWAEPYTAIR